MTNFDKPRKNHQYVCIDDASHSMIPELQELLNERLPYGSVNMGQAVTYAIKFTLEDIRKQEL